MQIEIKTLHLSFLQEEDEEDGPILYRDDDNMEDEGEADAADVADIADIADDADLADTVSAADSVS